MELNQDCLMDRKSLFLGIGLTEKFVQEFLKNASKSSDLESLILEAGIAESGCSASVGALLLELSTKLNKPSKFAMENRKKVLEYIVDGKISSIPQVTAAIEYLKKSNQWNVEEFEKKCGVGVVVKEEDIENEISGRINANLEAIRADRYQFDLMSILRAVREKFPWAEGKLVKQTFDRLVESVLGPKTEDDVEKVNF